jgi:peptidoglycan/LPS O-acetylase OafA/YrhL
MDNVITNRSSNNFDFLRLFAAFCVMIGHSIAHLGIPFLWVDNGDNWFRDGVPLFFILSGMLVYRSYEKCNEEGRPTTDFYRNRFLRIAPAIYAYMLATTIILLVIKAINIDVLSKASFWGWVASNLILVPVYFPDIMRHIGVGVLNGSLWTIPAEFSFYLVIPLIYLLEKRVGFKRSIISMFIIGLIASSVIWRYEFIGIEPLWLKFFGITFFSGLLYFSLGILWNRMWRYVPKSKYIFWLSISIYSLGVWVLQLSEYFGPTWNLVRAIPLSYAVVWFGYNGPNIFSKITNKIGDLSYGVYIWHMVVVNIFIFLNLPTKLSGLPNFVIQLLVITITFLISKLSWEVVEKPCLTLKHFTSRITSSENINSNMT